MCSGSSRTRSPASRPPTGGHRTYGFGHPRPARLGMRAHVLAFCAVPDVAPLARGLLSFYLPSNRSARHLSDSEKPCRFQSRAPGPGFAHLRSPSPAGSLNRLGKPVNGFSKAKDRIDGRMLRTWRALGRVNEKDRRNTSIPGWVNHDLRRTVRTHLSALPVQDVVRELIIAHTRTGLHKVYDLYAYLDEKRQCLELWSARLKAIVEPLPPNVIAVEKKRAVVP
jgi:hypothetical protein